jgi:hypothetical protein
MSLPPSTAADIARVARLNERYVKEWLGAEEWNRETGRKKLPERVTRQWISTPRSRTECSTRLSQLHED